MQRSAHGCSQKSLKRMPWPTLDPTSRLGSTVPSGAQSRLSPSWKVLALEPAASCST